METKKNILTTEENEFLEALDQGEHGPSDAFVDELEQKVVRTFETGSPSKSNFFGGLFMNLRNKKLFVGGVSILSVFLIAGIGYFTFSSFFSPDIQTKDQLTLEEILANAVEKNSMRGLGDASYNNLLSTKAFAENGNSLSADLAQSVGIPSPYGWEDYNYSTSTSTFTPGAAFDTCPVMNFPSVNSKTTSVSKYFYDDQGSSLSLNTLTDSKGNILNYFLSKGNESYIYYGGEYAVKLVFEDYLYEKPALDQSGMEPSDVIDPSSTDPNTPVSDPNTVGLDDTVTVDSDEVVEMQIEEVMDPQQLDQVEDPKDYISQFFGDNTTLIGTETLDGVDAYVVEWSYNSSCDFEDALTLEKATSSYAETNTPIDENTYTIIDRTWIDSESFLILKTESYINSADQANLIGTRVDRTITKNTTIAEVQNEFVYSLDPSIPVREVVYKSVEPNSEYYQAVALAKEQGIKLLFPTDTSLQLNYVAPWSTRVEGDDFYLDRAFYAPGVVGQNMFVQMNPSSISEYYVSVFNLSFSSADYEKSINIEYWNIEPAKVIDWVWGDSATRKESRTLIINGEEIRADVYVIDQTSYVDDLMPVDEPPATGSGSTGGSSGSYEGSDDRIEGENQYRYIIFEYDGYTISISETNTTVQGLKAYDLSVATDQSAVNGLVDEMYKRFNDSNDMTIDFPKGAETMPL